MNTNLFKLMNNQNPNFYKTLKVGLIANGFLRQILEDGLVPGNEVIDLLDGIKCNKLFNSKTGYPVLSPIPIYDKKNTLHLRTYAEPVNCLGASYYLSNDWYQKNKQLLVDWILKY